MTVLRNIRSVAQAWKVCLVFDIFDMEACDEYGSLFFQVPSITLP